MYCSYFFFNSNVNRKWRNYEFTDGFIMTGAEWIGLWKDRADIYGVQVECRAYASELD